MVNKVFYKLLKNNIISMENKKIVLEDYMSEPVYLINTTGKDIELEFEKSVISLKAGAKYMLERGKAQILATQMANIMFDGKISGKCDELGIPLHPKMKEFFDNCIKGINNEQSMSELGIQEVKSEKEEDFEELKDIDAKNKYTLDGVSYPNVGAYAVACRKKKKEDALREAQEKEKAMEENKSEEEKLKETISKKEKKSESEDDFEEKPEEENDGE